MLLSSHVLSDVQLLADRVVVIANGRLRGEGTLQQLAGGRSEVLVRSPAADRLAEALAAQGVRTRSDGDALFVTGATAAVVGETAHAHRIAVHELTPQQQSLEDVFLALTSESEIA